MRKYNLLAMGFHQHWNYESVVFLENRIESLLPGRNCIYTFISSAYHHNFQFNSIALTVKELFYVPNGDKMRNNTNL
jgi:hypothetical protein